jgi:hypothetical protein
MRWRAHGIQGEARANAQIQNEAKPLKKLLWAPDNFGALTV